MRISTFENFIAPILFMVAAAAISICILMKLPFKDVDSWQIYCVLGIIGIGGFGYLLLAFKKDNAINFLAGVSGLSCIAIFLGDKFLGL